MVFFRWLNTLCLKTPHNTNHQPKQGTKSPVFYIALAEKILTDQETLHIHALGSCIEAAVGVADRLVRNGLATVAKIKTDKGGRSDSTAQIVISVKKTSEFKALYDKQKEERLSRSAEFEVCGDT